jgi:hypothetical protein
MPACRHPPPNILRNFRAWVRTAKIRVRDTARYSNPHYSDCALVFLAIALKCCILFLSFL